MPELDPESKTAQLDKETALLKNDLKHLSFTFDKHAEQTKDGFRMLDDKLKDIVETNKQIVSISQTLSDVIVKHEHLDKKIDDKIEGLQADLKPIKKTVGIINNIWLIVSNIKTLIPVAGIIGAIIYYTMNT